jgi:hypothetical protein
MFRLVTAFFALALVIATSDASLLSLWFGKRHERLTENSHAAATETTPMNDAEPLRSEAELFAQRTKETIDAVAGVTANKTFPSSLSSIEEVSRQDGGGPTSNELFVETPGDRIHGVLNTSHSYEKEAKREISELAVSDLTRLGDPAPEIAHAPMTDLEATEIIEAELKALNMHENPFVDDKNTNKLSERTVESATAEHSALRSRVEQAMASLTSVYEMLSRKVADSPLPAPLSPPTSGNGQTEVSTMSLSAEDRTAQVTAAAARDPNRAIDGGNGESTPANLVGSMDAAEDGEPPLPPSSETVHISSGDGESQNSNAPLLGSPSVESAERPAAVTAQPAPSAHVEHENVVTAALSLFAGIVFVAAIGLMAAGFAHAQREQDVHAQPLYPPRGPSFV